MAVGVATLNLGAGNKPMASSDERTVVNHDLVKHRPEIAVAHNLDCLPWPWEDSTFDLIIASAVLEHLRLSLVETLDECWRILRPGGHLHLKVPHWQHDNSYADPTHRWHCSLRTFDYFDPDTKLGRGYGFYTSRKWRIVKPAQLNDVKSSIIATLEVRK